MSEEKKKNEDVMFISLKAVVSFDDWYIDSGASSHMTKNKILLNNPVAVSNKSVITANKSSAKIESCGDRCSVGAEK